MMMTEAERSRVRDCDRTQSPSICLTLAHSSPYILHDDASCFFESEIDAALLANDPHVPRSHRRHCMSTAVDFRVKES